jgi:hypothetical protein
MHWMYVNYKFTVFRKLNTEKQVSLFRSFFMHYLQEMSAKLVM